MHSLARGESDCGIFKVTRYHALTEVKLSFRNTLQCGIKEGALEFIVDVYSVNHVRWLTVIM
jgi:hypothetical protein